MLLLKNTIKTTAQTGLKYLSTIAELNPRTPKEKWDILSAVSLERRPIITRDFNELEKQFFKQLQDIEFEKSYKSNFEIRKEKDKKRAKEVKEGNVSITEMDKFPQQTANDFLDASIKELNSFEFAKRINSETVEKDPKSLKRALDRYLILLVNDQVGQKSQWILPQGKHKPGETLRDTAERILQEKCGTGIHAKFLGNAPSGFYKYRYPKAVQTGDSVGAKIFFFKAHILNGQAEVSDKKCSDFMWATRSELDILPYEYLKSVKMFLIDEEH